MHAALVGASSGFGVGISTGLLPMGNGQGVSRECRGARVALTPQEHAYRFNSRGGETRTSHKSNEKDKMRCVQALRQRGVANEECGGNVVMQLRGWRGIISTIKCQIESSTQEPGRDDSPLLPWMPEHAGHILSRRQKGRDGRTPCEGFHGNETASRFRFVG